MSYNKVALLTRRRSETGTRNRHQRILERFGPYTSQYMENVDEKMKFLWL